MSLKDKLIITCVIDSTIDPTKIADFESFEKVWIDSVRKRGGLHHDYFLPSEGASDRTLALFSFESLAAHEQYRTLFGVDCEFVEAYRIGDESKCVIRYERTFMRPILRSHIHGR